MPDGRRRRENDRTMCGTEMRPMKYLSKIALLAGLAAAPSAFATPYDTLQSIAGTYNVFLLGNLGSAAAPFQGTDSQGRVAVAGNAYVNNSAINGNNVSGDGALIVGGNLSQTGGSIAGNAYVGGDATLSNTGSVQNLVVGGSLTDSGGQISGNVFVGGASTNLSGGVTINGSLSLTGANSTLNAASNGGSSPSAVYVTASSHVNDPSYWATAKTSGGPATPSTPLDVFGGSTDITNASTSLTALSGATSVASTGGTINITLSKNGLNVINLSVANGATITGINITNANGVVPTGLIINVNGNNLNFNGGTFNLGSLSNTNVLFNFGNATSLNLQNLAFEGALLAPLATVNFSSGHIDGALIANTYLGPGQINNVGFNDPLPAYSSSGGTVVATPEPGSILLFGSGLVVLGFYGRRRSMAGAPIP
jgi:choice-of-anchor A domain-containing protein